MAGATHYTASSSQYAEANVTPRSSMPMSWSAWVRPTLASRGAVISVCNGGVSANYWYIDIDTGGTVSSIKTNVSSSVAGGGQLVTANTWWHIGCAFASATSNTCYVGGVAGSTQATSVTPSGSTRTDIGCRAGSTRDRFFDGDIAMVALWGNTLSADHFKALASGAHPLDIRSVGIKFLSEDGSGWCTAHDGGNIQSLSPVNSPVASNSGPPVRPWSGRFHGASDLFAVDTIVGRDRFFFGLAGV